MCHLASSLLHSLLQNMCLCVCILHLLLLSLSSYFSLYATCFLDEADGIIHDDVSGLPKCLLDCFPHISFHPFKWAFLLSFGEFLSNIRAMLEYRSNFDDIIRLRQFDIHPSLIVRSKQNVISYIQLTSDPDCDRMQTSLATAQDLIHITATKAF